MSSDPHAKSGNPPWGKWEVLLDEPCCKVKKITVLPDKRLSYQLHHRRQEHWLVVEGEALVILDDKEIRLKVGDYIDIPQEAKHRICNDSNAPMIFIEIQRGTYFGEDDIIRLQDDYGRKS